MTAGKRATDLLLALAGVVILAPLILGVALAVRLCDGAPVLYRAPRMRAPDRPFLLWKFRTMRPDPADVGVSGGDKAVRITRLGRLLRRAHLDELPQLWNLLRGDMSLVGPRPPLPRYVAACPALYAEVLRCRPGLTGLATLRFHRTEARLLAPCRSAAETEAVYLSRCIPAKARLDLLYARRRAPGLDLAIILKTLLPWLPLGLEGRRAAWRRYLIAYRNRGSKGAGPATGGRTGARALPLRGRRAPTRTRQP